MSPTFGTSLAPGEPEERRYDLLFIEDYSPIQKQLNQKRVVHLTPGRTYEIRRQIEGSQPQLGLPKDDSDGVIFVPFAGDKSIHASMPWVQLGIEQGSCSGWLKYVGEPEASVAYLNGRLLQRGKQCPVFHGCRLGTGRTHFVFLFRVRGVERGKDGHEFDCDIEDQLRYARLPRAWQTRSDRLRGSFLRALGFAKAKQSVLLLGPTGCGKEVVAEWLHYMYAGGDYLVEGSCVLPMEPPAAALRFVPFNCGAFTPTLIDSELFGAVLGAATDVRPHPGMLSHARNGTFFIDELHLLPAEAQARFYRFLSEREIRRVGAEQADVLTPAEMPYVVSAAKEDRLRTRRNEGAFMPDLLYRLVGEVLVLPPLCERRDDVPDLARAILEELHEEVQTRVWEESRPRLPMRLSDGAVVALQAHPFEGNLRELRTILRRGAVQAIMSGRPHPEEIVADDLGLEVYVNLGNAV